MGGVVGVDEENEEDAGAGDVGVSAGAEVGVDGFAAGVSIAIGVLSSAVGRCDCVSSMLGVVVVFVVVSSVIGVESGNRNGCGFSSSVYRLVVCVYVLPVVCQSMR